MVIFSASLAGTAHREGEEEGGREEGEERHLLDLGTECTLNLLATIIQVQKTL